MSSHPANSLHASTDTRSNPFTRHSGPELELLRWIWDLGARKSLAIGYPVSKFDDFESFNIAVSETTTELEDEPTLFGWVVQVDAHVGYFSDLPCPLSPMHTVHTKQPLFARVTFRCTNFDPLSITFWTDPVLSTNTWIEFDDHILCGVEWLADWKKVLEGEMLQEMCRLLDNFNYRKAIWLGQEAVYQGHLYILASEDDIFINVDEQVAAFQHFWEEIESEKQPQCVSVD